MNNRFYGCIVILLITVGLTTAKAQESYQPSQENLEAREWFQNAKFGMFIHWGLYSILGDGEWVMNNQHIKKDNYERLADFFDPEEFDAEAWVSLAKAAGMKYITITTRHHDGFSMFDTEASDYNIVDDTPYGKDIIAKLAEEAHNQGLKIFFYYSLLDWHNTDYYPRGRTGHNLGRPDHGNWDDYIEFMKTQLTELLTNYGSVGGIWFDGHWDHVDWDGQNWGDLNIDWHYDEIYPLIHKLQPAAMIGNNHHLDPLPGEDFQMFERTLPGEQHEGWGGPEASDLPLESAKTMNGSWGFNLQDNDYKTTKELIHALVKSAGNNANLLLNVGPMPNGKIQPEFRDTLKAIGEWTDQYGETIYGTRSGDISPREWGVSTKKDGINYVHILDAKRDTLFIHNFPGTLKSAKYYDGGASIEYKQMEEGVFLYLKEEDLQQVDTIIEMEIDS